MITIRHANGIRYEAPLASGAKCSCRHMQEEYIVIPFTTVDKVHFEIGDYVDLAAKEYDEIGLYSTLRKRYVVTTVQVPTYNKGAGVYEWQLRLDAYYWAWNNRVFKFRPRIFGQEASWGLTDKVGRFMEIFADNLDAYGFGEYSAVIDAEIQEYNINLSFQGTKMCDALKMICDKVNEEYNAECEWWVDGNTIHIGRCELEGAEHVIAADGDDLNAESIIPEQSEQEYANRLIVFGGTQNLSARYRKNLVFEVGKAEKSGNNILIRDIVKTDLSASMFRERTRKPSRTVSESVDYITESSVRYFERFAKVQDLEASIVSTVKSNSYFQHYNTWLKVKVTGTISPMVAKFTRFGSAGNPCKDAAYTPYYMGPGEARLFLERASDKYRIEVGTIAPSLYGYSTEPHYDVNYSGDVVDTELSKGDYWYLRVEFYSTMQNQGADGDVYLIVSDTLTCVVEYPDAEKADTTIKIGNATYPCTVNPNWMDSSYDESRDILVKGIAGVAVGTKFEFPTIVKGKVPAGYFSVGSSDDVVNSIVQRNLMLPESVGTNYIDVVDGLTEDQVVEKVVIFDKIFPKQELSIKAVGHYTHDTEEEDSEGADIGIKEGVLTKTHYYWQFILDDLEFNKDCLIDGVELGIKFEKAQKLTGLSFKLAWQPTKDTIGTGDDAHRWEIVNNEDYGIELPNSTMRPYPGDKVIITGWNCEALDDDHNLIGEAEEKLLEEALKMADSIAKDPHTYSIAMMSDYMHDYPVHEYPLKVGTMLTLRNDYLFKTGERVVRIIGYDVNLDLPYDTPIIIAGEKLEYSNARAARERLDAIDNGNLSATPFVTN